MNANWKTQIKDFEKIANYSYLGLRSLCEDENYKIGDYTRNSRDWDAENHCSSDNEINGTSAVSINNAWLDGIDDLNARIIDMLPEMETYNGGEHIVLIGGWESSYGTDDGEIVIVNAEVLAIIK